MHYAKRFCPLLIDSTPLSPSHARFSLAVPQKTSSFATVLTPNPFTLSSRFERFLEKLNYRMTIKH